MALQKNLVRVSSTVNAYCCNRQQPNLATLYVIAQLLSVELKDLIADSIKSESVDKH